MDFNKLLEVASAQQSNLDQQKKSKTETKSTQPSRIRKERQKGVISANVKAFLERREKQEKKKEEGEQRKKEELLRKREEARHGKAAKAMASRTKDNLQFYTKEKLDRFVAEEKERYRKQQEKEERKHQKKLEKFEKERRSEEGIKRKRRTKYEIAKDKGQNVELPKPTVGVTIERKPKKRPTPKQSQPPPLGFNALIRMAQEKQSNPGQSGAQNKPGQSGAKVETKRPQPGRPMTQEEKERWERLQSKEYQNFLKKGGKRPEFPGAKKIKENCGERNSRESSLEPKSNNKSIIKSKDIPRKSESKSTESKKFEGKKPLLNGSTSKISEKLKHKREESPEPEVNETVIQCGPSKSKATVKRKSEETGSNPFDRIIKRYDVHRPPPEKKYRQVIESDSEEEYDSDMDDFIDDGDEENDYSAAIRDIFGYDKKKYRYEDDDVSDMEAKYASIMKEEIRSAKIGMMEDLEDMKREEEELKRKAERKKMREKELKKKRR